MCCNVLLHVSNDLSPKLNDIPVKMMWEAPTITELWDDTKYYKAEQIQDRIKEAIAAWSSTTPSAAPTEEPRNEQEFPRF